MPTRTTFVSSTPGFVADHGSMRLVPGGRQIDWATVDAGYLDATTGKKVIPAGTPMAQIDATGKITPRGLGAATGGRTTIGLLTSDAHEDRAGFEALSGYGVISGAVVFEGHLPPDSLDATVRTELKALDGGGFAFETYTDNRAS